MTVLRGYNYMRSFRLLRVVRVQCIFIFIRLQLLLSESVNSVITSDIFTYIVSLYLFNYYLYNSTKASVIIIS